MLLRSGPISHGLATRRHRLSSRSGRISGDEVKSALEAAQLASFVPRLDEENGWGQRLSAAMQQRVAIAAPLLEKPDCCFSTKRPRRSTNSLSQNYIRSCTTAAGHDIVFDRPSRHAGGFPSSPPRDEPPPTAFTPAEKVWHDKRAPMAATGRGGPPSGKGEDGPQPLVVSTSGCSPAQRPLCRAREARGLSSRAAYSCWR